MASDEFSLIERYFTSLGQSPFPVRLSIGDDAAVLDIPSDRQLVSSLDTLNVGVHFLPDTAPEDIACKALAVNLSDLAAMAADPAWFLLSLSLPEVDESWLERFSGALAKMAEVHRIELVGGDTCRGALSISIQVAGLVPRGAYITRGQARPGDLILVSGELGNAALGLAQLKQEIQLPKDLVEQCLSAINRPRPRLELIPFLRRFAHAAIDISDGLQGDLCHILKASGVGAVIDHDAIPVNRWIRERDAMQYALTGGDDYEICCTLAASHRDQIAVWNRDNPDCQLTLVGEVTESGFYLRQAQSSTDLADARGYRHFD